MLHLSILLSLFVDSFANPLIGDDTAVIAAAKQNEFPFVVSIGLAVQGRGHFCTGSLISRTHVLTAAHCFRKIGRSRNVRVLVGSSDLSSGGTMYRLSRSDSWITYDDWARQTGQACRSRYAWNDIAILTLSQEVDEEIPLAIISGHGDDRHYGETAVTAGWGDMKEGIHPNLMQKASLRVMSRTECEDNMVEVGYPREHAQENELCTSADPQVLLGWGDSGGPLLINGSVIIGVNEAICPKGEPPIPRAFNLHVSIDYYRQFIGQITNLVV